MVRAVGGNARSALGKSVSFRIPRGPRSANSRHENRPRPPGPTVPDPPQDAPSHGEDRSCIPRGSLEKKNTLSPDRPIRQSFRPRQCPKGADFERPREGMNAKTSHVEVALYCLLGCATASSIGALIELQPPNSDQRSNACVLQVTWLLLRNECGVSDACCE